MCGQYSTGSGQVTVAVSCEHGTEPSGFMKVISLPAGRLGFSRRALLNGVSYCKCMIL
jgi:hypothetical protein